MLIKNSIMSIHKFNTSNPPPAIIVSFDTNFGAQFTKQSTTDYDVYTVIGQTATDRTTLTTWSDFVVNATMQPVAQPRTIYYVCIGGGGYTFNGTSVSTSNGGAGAGAYYEGSYVISNSTNFTFNAGGSYKTSYINSTFGNVIAGYGGYANRNTFISSNGVNGSSGGGGGSSNTSPHDPGTGNPPGNNGGIASIGSTTRAGGGGGGAGGAGGNGSAGIGGAGGIGKIPTSPGISSIYTNPLCVGGSGHGIKSGIASKSITYGSGAVGTTYDSLYRYGSPGAIIIAVPKT